MKIGNKSRKKRQMTENLLPSRNTVSTFDILRGLGGGDEM